MKERFEHLVESFNSRAIRERLLIVIGAIAIIYLVWDFTVYQPNATDKKRLNQQLNAVDSEMVKLTAEQQVFVKALTNDPLAAKRREIVRLEQELKNLDKDLENLSVGLVSANKLPQIVHDVLASNEKLKLIGMLVKSPEKLELQNASITESTDVGEAEHETQTNQVETLGVFKHSVVVEIEGGYFDIVEYVTRLEGLEWRFYWERAEYNVERYPNASVLLEIYTLSTEKGVIGV